MTDSYRYEGPVNVSIDDDELGNVSMTKMGSLSPTRRAPLWRNACFAITTLIVGIVLLNAVPVFIWSSMNANGDGDGDFDDGDVDLDGEGGSSSPLLLEQVQVTQTLIGPTDASQIGYDGIPSPFSKQADFGHAVAMSAEGSRIAVASAPGQQQQQGAAGPAGLVHVFHYNVTWKYEQTLLAEDNSAPLADTDYGIAPPVQVDPSFHPAIDMSEDGERVVFSTPHKSVAVFGKLSQVDGYKWRQLGPSMTTPHANEHVVDVAISASGLTVAILWHNHSEIITSLDHKSLVRIYQDVVTTHVDSENPVIDNWVFRAEIKLLSHGHGTLSFDYSGNLLAVGQHSEDGVPAVVSVYTANEADPSEWLPFGDVMVDNQYTPEGSDTPLALGGVVHFSGDGSTLAVGGKDNIVTVLKFQYTDAVEWTPAGVIRGVGMSASMDGVGMSGMNAGMAGMGESKYSGFGASVSLNRYGTRLVVGAPEDGSIHLYVLDPDTQEWRLVANDSEHPATVYSKNQSDNFGKAVCINAEGDKVLVGAPQATAFGTVTAVQIGPISP